MTGRLLRSSARPLSSMVLCLALCGSLLTTHASIRGRGKYSGVVIFDRWDTCFLLSGYYIMYIANSEKEKLRPYAGHAIQIDATDVIQPMNPGDGLIRSFAILGPAPDDPRDPLPDGLHIEISSDFGAHGVPAFLVTARNIGNHEIKIDGSQFGPTVLGENRGMPFSASDGASVAWITRFSLLEPGSSQWTTDGPQT